jgi:hypothetical protein
MIVNIGTWSNVYLQYDTETLEYIVNPNGDSLGMIGLGLNNTRYTQAQLSALHDGVEVFAGRSDYVGHYASFPFTLNMYGTLTDVVRVKQYVDRDPVVAFTGSLNLYETELTEDPEDPTQVYYDAHFTVDAGYAYEQLGNTERWYFEKGVYGTISKSITFTDGDTGRSTVLLVDVEFAEVNTAVKIFDFVSDEFLFLDDLGLDEEINTQPNGSIELHHRTTPVYDTTSRDYYHTTEALKNFVVTPRSAPVVDVQVSPKMEIALDCSSNLSYRLNDTKSFKPEETWLQSKFFFGSGSFVIFGRCGSTLTNGTYALANHGDIDIRMGGTLNEAVATYDTTKVNYIAWQNRYTGTEWVDDLVLNETVVYTARNTDRGALVADVYATEGGIWNVDTNTDPQTDAQQLVGGLHSALRIGFTETVIGTSSRALFYRNYKHFLTVMCGDSYVEGVPVSLTKPHWKFGSVESTAKYYRTEYINVAKASSTFYTTLPITPDAGKDALPQWVLGSRPSPASESSCEYMIGFSPDDVTMSFNWNESNNEYNEPNIDGWNSYADELYWGMTTVKDYMEARDINFFAYGLAPTNTVTTKYDGKTLQVVQKEMADALRTNLTDDWFILMFDYLVDVDGLSLKSTYSAGDNIHVNDAGQLLYANSLKEQRESYLIDRRDKSFNPVVTVETPSVNQTFSVSNIEAQYFCDGVFSTTSNAVTSESTSITVTCTNTANKTTAVTVPISYSAQTDTTLGFSLPLTSDYSDNSGRCRNIIKENGSPVIESGSLLITGSNLDVLVIPNSTDILKKNELWSLLLEVYISSNGNMIGRIPTTSSDKVGYNNIITNGWLFAKNRGSSGSTTIPINTWVKLMLVHASTGVGTYTYRTYYDSALARSDAGDIGNENTINFRIGAGLTTNVDDIFNNTFTSCSTFKMKNVLYYERELDLDDFLNYEAGLAIDPIV